MRRVVCVVALLAVACGEPPKPVTRTVIVRPVQRVLTPDGVRVEPRNGWVQYLDPLRGPRAFGGGRTADSFIFEGLPEGPALFEVEEGRFVYTARDSFEVCSQKVLHGAGEADAGVELQLALPLPAQGGRVLTVQGSLPELGPQSLGEVDAGSIVVSRRQSWQYRPLLRGRVTVLQSASDVLDGGFTRTFAIGALDAGVFSQQAGDLVRIEGTLAPLSRAPDQLLTWDGTSFDLLGAGLLDSLRFRALREGAELASVSGSTRETTVVPIALPQLAPDAFRVSAYLKVDLGGGLGTFAPVFWKGPWVADGELRLRHLPPTELVFSSDGAQLSWRAPEVAPDSYVVSLQSPADVNSFFPLGTFLTDQTSIVIPAALRTRNMVAVVSAITRPSVPSWTCSPSYWGADSEASIPAISARWNPF